MYIEQIYTGCLAQASYYIESAGEAAIIDPMREAGPYLDLAARRGAVIRYVFETHLHADFVSGHLDIARACGAQVVFGPGTEAGYAFYRGKDGEEFKLGFITLRLLHTPGHTPESVCLLLMDERNNPHSVFTGDTLFVGDVGRPDLSVSAESTPEQQAGLLYDSIESKLLPLPNYVVVYPGHGAGSACGKSIGSERYSTIGNEKETSYALKARDRETFISLVTDGLYEAPKYFAMDAAINKTAYAELSSIIRKSKVPLTVSQVKACQTSSGAAILDCRSAGDVEAGFIPGSILIGLDGKFAFTAGMVADPESQLVLVAPEGREQEAITRLARVGLTRVSGYLEGGFPAWLNSGEPVDEMATVSASLFEERFRYNSCTVVDVRNPDEWIPGFVAGARLIPLQQLELRMREIEKHKPCYIYCASGYRSHTAASLLKRKGYHQVVHVKGGMEKIRETTIGIRQLTARVN